MKKFISLILTVTMVFSIGAVAFPSAVYAADVPQQIEDCKSPSVIISGENVKETAVDLIEVLANINLSFIKIPTSFDDFTDMLVKLLFELGDTIIDVLLTAINHITPSVDFEDKDTYKNEQFYEGMETYLREPAAGAVWSLGYSSRSIQTGNELDGKHYVGGSLSFPKPKTVTAVYDDQRVRCAAVNDGSGRGTVVFAIIDGFGLSNTDVRGIREKLADFARKNDIVGINIGVLHQHSCVDTFGMNGDLLKMVFANPAINIVNRLFNKDIDVINGQNKEFMANLYEKTVEAVMEAVNSMTEGSMYYSKVFADRYIKDKREPMINDKYIHRLRFVPSDGSRETWICNAAIHCVGNGAAGKEVTGDYPYYMEQVINKRADANFMLIEGAELAITLKTDTISLPEGSKRMDYVKAYGETLANLIIDSGAKESKVAPLLNYRMNEYFVPVKNGILTFAGKMGALTNTVVSNSRVDCDIEVATEIGYLEFGRDIAVAIIPGELEPGIAYGGYLDASESFTGKDFDYTNFTEIMGNGKELLIFGLMNDQIGYIIPDNDYSSILSGVNEELVSTGDKAGSSTIDAFEKLYKSIGA